MRTLLFLACLTAFSTLPAHAETVTQPLVNNSFSYADLADIAVTAPIAAVVLVDDAIPLKGAQAADVPPGVVRLYVEATVQTLIRGADGLQAQVNYLVDVPLGPSNRPPRLRKARMLVLAAPVPGRPGTLQLVAPDAQIGWTPETEQRVRAILVEAASKDAPPHVTGIGNAFHVPGAIPGESETQIFLTTQNGRPISLNVLRRPQEDPRWAVALGEMVDEAATPPKPETLLWYQLACFLPARLPDSSVSSMSDADAAATRDDYQLILQRLGPCARTRQPR
ncbi:hypothetical protein [Flavisphingomonas formosensis]|uniref:hypothetical protein n=1 Tax=Flavisphingomonas formosensis TaxID=861534 RepID=UPI001E5FA64C|nr:hypothetical protein [Sphingomonas formosensis]